MDNYKIISMDFDGTLLTNNKRITKRTENKLIQLKKEKYIIGITARNLSSVNSVCDLNMFNYLIINNGANIYNTRTKTLKYVKNIETDVMEEITKRFKNEALEIDYISPYKYYIYRNGKRVDFREFVIHINDVSQIEEGICRLNIFFEDYNEVNKYKEYIENNYKQLDCIIMQDTDSNKDKKWLAINPKNVNKFTTLKELSESLDIKVDEIIFFGDSANDLDIIEKVGLGVAMGNALPEVKERAKQITLSNEKDGIACFLDKLT